MEITTVLSIVHYLPQVLGSLYLLLSSHYPAVCKHFLLYYLISHSLFYGSAKTLTKSMPFKRGAIGLFSLTSLGLLMSPHCKIKCKVFVVCNKCQRNKEVLAIRTENTGVVPEIIIV